jgi:anti-sigma B factor antagonist
MERRRCLPRNRGANLAPTRDAGRLAGAPVVRAEAHVEIPVRRRDCVAILEPQGRMTLGLCENQLVDAAKQSLDDGATDLLVSFAAVPAIDSAGIGELIATYTTVSRRSNRLKLLHTPSRVHDILQLTFVLTLFEVYDDEERALSSFGTT